MGIKKTKKKNQVSLEFWPNVKKKDVIAAKYEGTHAASIFSCKILIILYKIIAKHAVKLQKIV